MRVFEPFSWPRAAVAAAIATLISLVAIATAQGPSSKTPSSNAEESAAYRRIFVPADQVEAWPTHGARYAPIDRDEFQRRIQQLGERQQLRALGGAQLASAEYSAQMTANGVLRGQASLSVRVPHDLPSILRLAPLSPLVNDAHWRDSKQDGSPAKATIGLWTNSNSSKPEYGVWAPRSGTLDLEFNLPPKAQAEGKFEYQLQLPPAVSQTFSLTLPQGYTPSLNPAATAQAPAIQGGSRNYKFRLAPSPQYVLSIVSTDRPAQPPAASLPLVSIAETYGLSPEGLDYQAELRVQPHGSNAKELRVVLSTSVRVTEARINGASASWRRDEQDIESTLISLPEGAAVCVVTLRGLADAAMNAPWQLPRITVPQAIWTEGTTALGIHPALELQSIEPRGSQILNVVGVTPGAAEGEAYRLQAWSPEATTEIVLAQRRPQLHGACSILAELGEHELSGRAHATVWARGGAMLQLSSSTTSDWSIESVEATKPEDIVEWHVDGENDERRLFITLRRSPAETSPVTLKIAARKPRRSGAASFTLGELNWLTFEGGSLDERFLFVKDGNNGRLSLQNAAASIPTLTPEDIPAKLRENFGDLKAGLCFDVARLDANAKVRSSSGQSQIHGKAWIELTAGRTGFEQKAEILCEPMGAVEELSVEASRPLPPNAKWSIADHDDVILVEREGPHSEAGQAEQSQRTRYHVRLPSSFRSPFRLKIAWRSGSTSAESVVNFTLAGAESWQSWAILRGDERMVKVDPHGCTPAALPDFTRSDATPALGCYRLMEDPTSPFDPTPSMSLAGSRTQADASSVVCVNSEISTLQFADGHQIHRITYDLHTRGEQVINLSVPPEFTIAKVRLDGVEAAADRDEQSGEMTVRLSGRQPRVSLQLDLTSAEAPLKLSSAVRPPEIEASFPVVKGRWTVFSPPGLRTHPPVEEDVNQNNWLRRLFGPLIATTHLDSALNSNEAYASAAAPNEPDATGEHRQSRMLACPSTWKATTQEFASTPTPVSIISMTQERAAWRLLWLAAAFCAARWQPHARRAFWLLLLATAIGAQILPVDWVFIPQSLLLGLIAGALARQVWNICRLSDKTPAIAMAAVLAILLGAFPSHADEPTSSPSSVLFPIDSNGDETGSDVYVPEPLLKQILALDAPTTIPNADAVLLGAHYEVTLAEKAERNALNGRTCTVQLTWRTFRPDQQVRLPLEQSDGQWQADATLDGKTVTIDWNSGGHGCHISCPQPGDHEFSTRLVPKTSSSSTSNQLQLHIPPLPGATVKVIKPESLTQATIPAAMVQEGASDGARMSAKLLARNLLQVNWPASAAAESGLSVEQLSVLHVDPASARVTTQLRFSGEPTDIKTLNVSVCGQLKLLAPDSSLYSVTETDDGSGKNVRLNFRDPQRLPATVELEFQVQRNTSVGRLAYPCVHILGAKIRSNYFVVEVSPLLQSREEKTVGLTPIDSSEIAKSWNELPERVTHSYSIGANEPSWSLQVEPVVPRITARESMTVLCRANDARIAYQAAMNPPVAERFIYRLNVPSSLKLDEVGIVMNGRTEKTPLRWSRPRPDRLYIFLAQPIAGPHSITVTGHRSYTSDRTLPVEPMGLDSTLASPLQVAIRRESSVLVNVSPVADMQTSKTPTAQDNDGIPVAQLAITRSDDAGFDLSVLDNEVHFSVDSATNFTTVESEPTVRYVLQATVTHGTLDRIQLAVPKNWRMPHSPSAKVQVFALPTGEVNEQRLEIRLPYDVASGSHVSFELTGSLSTDADRRLRFPAIRVLNADAERRYFVYSEAAGDWSRPEPEIASLPETLASRLNVDKKVPAYLVKSDGFVAERHALPNALRRQSAPLVKNRVTIGDNGEWSAVSELIVQPGEAREFAIQLPEQATLLYASINDQPVSLRAVEANKWQTPAGPKYLPRLITLAYRVPPITRGSHQIEAPRIAIGDRTLPWEQCLWSVNSDARLGMTSIDDGEQISWEAYQRGARRVTLATAVAASSLALQLPESESNQWLKPWSRRLDNRSAGVTASMEQESTWSKIRQQLPTTNSTGNDFDEMPFPAAGGAEAKNAVYFQTASIALDLSTESDPVPGRWFAALAIAAVAGVAYRRPRTLDNIAAALRSQPALFALALGLFWWLAFTPRWIGPIIIVLAVAVYTKRRRLALEARQRRQARHNLDTTSSRRSSPSA